LPHDKIIPRLTCCLTKDVTDRDSESAKQHQEFTILDVR